MLGSAIAEAAELRPDWLPAPIPRDLPRGNFGHRRAVSVSYPVLSGRATVALSLPTGS